MAGAPMSKEMSSFILDFALRNELFLNGDSTKPDTRGAAEAIIRAAMHLAQSHPEEALLLFADHPGTLAELETRIPPKSEKVEVEVVAPKEVERAPKAEKVEQTPKAPKAEKVERTPKTPKTPSATSTTTIEDLTPVSLVIGGVVSPVKNWRAAFVLLAESAITSGTDVLPASYVKDEDPTKKNKLLTNGLYLYTTLNVPAICSRVVRLAGLLGVEVKAIVAEGSGTREVILAEAPPTV